MLRLLLGLSAFASGSPLLALLASGSGVFFNRGLLGGWRAFEQAGMDAGNAHLHVGNRQLSVGTIERGFEGLDLALLGRNWLGRASRPARLQSVQRRLQRPVAQVVEP
jgi:hypothetical protein